MCSHVIHVDVVVVAPVDIGRTITTVLGDRKSFFVSLVIRASNNLLVEIGDLVSSTICVTVLTKDDSLTENLVVSGTAIAVVRFLRQVLDSRSLVALVWVAVRTNAVLVVVAILGAVTWLLGSLVVGSRRLVLACVGSQLVAVALSVKVSLTVTAATIRTVLVFGSLATVLTTI